MLIAFIGSSFCLGLFMSFVWGTSSASNVLIKMTFSLYTFWAGVMLLAQFAPYINTGAMRLI